MMHRLYGWHVAAADADGQPRLDYGDGRVVRAGETLHHEGVVRSCLSGLHVARNIMSAMRYRREGWLCRVWVEGDLDFDFPDDRKAAGRSRHCLGMMTVEEWVAALRQDGLKRMGSTPAQQEDFDRYRGDLLRSHSLDYIVHAWMCIVVESCGNTGQAWGDAAGELVRLTLGWMGLPTDDLPDDGWITLHKE